MHISGYGHVFVNSHQCDVLVDMTFRFSLAASVMSGDVVTFASPRLSVFSLVLSGSALQASPILLNAALRFRCAMSYRSLILP